MEKTKENKMSKWYEKWSMFEEPKSKIDPQEHPLFIFVFTLIFVVGCIVVSVWVIWTCVNESSSTLKVYKSNNPQPRPGYTCACSLPGDGSDPAALKANDPKILHRCYEQEKLETVTVFQLWVKVVENILQYDPSINLLGPGMQHISMNNKSTVLKTLVGGYEVEVDSKVTEVTLKKGDPKGYLDLLNPYKGMESNTIDIPLDDIMSSRRVLDIPTYYVRWGFEFDCANCSTCSPSQLQEKIPNFAGNVDIQWASCFAYGQSSDQLANKCSQGKSYHGKCILHPTSSVPPLFALREFLHNFRSFQSITNITGLESGMRTPNALTLEPSFMYLVESDIKQIPNISWGFIEVDEQHEWWLVLHDLYPSISQECRKLSRVQICHLPKLCSSTQVRLDQEDVSHSHTRCIQQAQNTSLCQEMVASTGMEIDNHSNDNEVKENQTARICPKSAICKQVPPNYVIYRPPTNSRVIGIDSKNYIPGWCTNIYRNVLRYNGSKLLSTSCVNGLCHLTGRYNEINDGDEDVHILSLQEYNPESKEQSFMCYKLKRKSIMRWAIDTFGVLFGWIGTLQLAFVVILSILFGFLKRVEEDDDISLDPL